MRYIWDIEWDTEWDRGSSLLKDSAGRTQKDKISRLPDDILLYVLSKLELKNVVQTSILAKRWRYLWAFIPNIDFDPGCLSPDNRRICLSTKTDPAEYLEWVDKIIDAHRAPCVTNLKFYFYHRWSNNRRQVEKWIQFGFSKKVQELELYLREDTSPRGFSLGSDMLKQPHNAGFVNLKSLCLTDVGITGETIEFILSSCNHLERLYVCCSHSLHTLNVLSDKLKHLSLLGCKNLKELQIDARNLISFRYQQHCVAVRAHMVFTCVPNLVETAFAGKLCASPFPVFEQISSLSKQLTKLSFHPHMFEVPDFTAKRSVSPVQIDLLFPNVKQLTLTVYDVKRVEVAIKLVKFFVDLCPILHKLVIQIYSSSSKVKDEAKQLQVIEDENVERKAYEENGSYPNLKVLEIVGFEGCDNDVEFALAMIACGSSFETLICDQRHFFNIGKRWEFENTEKIDTIKRRACKLAKLLPANVEVGVPDKSGIFWV